MPARQRRGWPLLLGLLLMAVAAGIVLVARHDAPGSAAPGPAAPSTSGRPSSPPSTPTARPGGVLTLAELSQVDPVSQACLLGRPAWTANPKLSATSRWHRGFADGFAGLDRNRWNLRDGLERDNDDDFVSARNVTTRGGHLVIQARREVVGGRDYTSGFVDTDGLYSLPSTFQVRVRAKVPMRYGLWAAPLWLRPTDRGAGEIDLVETTYRPGEGPRLHQSIHTAYGPGQRVFARRFPFSAIGDPTGTRWHTYVLRKTPGLMVMWVDGRVTAAFCAGSPGWYDKYYDAGKRWNLRMNLQVGGWGGRPRARQSWAGDRASLLIDSVTTWVRGTR